MRNAELRVESSVVGGREMREDGGGIMNPINPEASISCGVEFEVFTSWRRGYPWGK